VLGVRAKPGHGEKEESEHRPISTEFSFTPQYTTTLLMLCAPRIRSSVSLVGSSGMVFVSVHADESRHA
jgi:hypothetical protein